MKITESRLKQIIKEEMDMLKQKEAPPDMFGEPDEEGGMARNELVKIAKYGQDIHDMLKDDDQLPAWVQSKITKCAMLIGDVKHFLEGEKTNTDSDTPETEPKESGLEVELGGDKDLEEMIAEELSSILEKKKVNPWAVCTTSVGREDKEKYERCVMDVKKQQGME